MKQVKAKIILNEKAAPERFRMRLEAPSIAKEARPGQFLMLKCQDDPLFMLRRPLAFHRIMKDSFDVLYQVVGKGTEILAQRKPGETLDVIGPLGNGFTSHVPRPTSHVILIAGGIAVAPLLAFAEALPKKICSKSVVIIGACTKSHILCVDEFKKLGLRVEIATEDGTMGEKGLATDALKDFLRSTPHALRSTIFACGPKRMLKEVAKIARTNEIKCEVSLEEKMACGTGVCLGCAVKTVKGNRLVCKDGPVFNAEEIVW